MTGAFLLPGKLTDKIYFSQKGNIFAPRLLMQIAKMPRKWNGYNSCFQLLGAKFTIIY